jgi:hypothetical protein
MTSTNLCPCVERTRTLPPRGRGTHIGHKGCRYHTTTWDPPINNELRVRRTEAQGWGLPWGEEGDRGLVGMPNRLSADHPALGSSALKMT